MLFFLYVTFADVQPANIRAAVSACRPAWRSSAARCKWCTVLCCTHPSEAAPCLSVFCVCVFVCSFPSHFSPSLATILFPLRPQTRIWVVPTGFSCFLSSIPTPCSVCVCPSSTKPCASIFPLFFWLSRFLEIRLHHAPGHTFSGTHLFSLAAISASPQRPTYLRSITSFQKKKNKVIENFKHVTTTLFISALR